MSLNERRKPLSIEELLRQKKEKESENAKPKFLSKKEREKLALIRKNNQVNNNFTGNVVANTNKNSNNKNPDNKNQIKETKNLSHSTVNFDDSINKRIKKKRKIGDRKFNFGWNNEDDTTSHSNVQDILTIATNYEKNIKNFTHTRKATEEVHWSQKPLNLMRERDWRIFKEDFSISMKGSNLPHPMRSWQESGLPPRILATVKAVGYVEPSPIQRASIPISLIGRDVIGIAETGSGKTAAFVLPLLSYIMELPSLSLVSHSDLNTLKNNKNSNSNSISASNGPYAIILAPTRELAQQIESETEKFASRLGFNCVSIVGGHTIEEQVHNLSEGAEIVIATPGRLVDCLERRVLVLSQCCFLVMDEADRMIDMGFEDSVTKILSALPTSTTLKRIYEDDSILDSSSSFLTKNRQTMMFTATMPPTIERMTRKYLTNPGTVIIGSAGQAVDTVEQQIEFINGEERRKNRMLQIIKSHKFKPPIIVFVNIKRNCDSVARELSRSGIKTVTLHGDKSQEQRERALASLRRGDADVLVATDLAGRGIDVPDVSLVLNFNMANNIESYTHRIGRTGRAGKYGTAITFVDNSDADTFYDLRQMIKQSPLSRVPDELRRHAASLSKPGKTSFGKEIIM